MPTKHYLYGGSTAARTNACTVWRAIAAGMPKSNGDGSNMFADRGTLLHNATEAFLKGDIDTLEDALGMTYNDQVLDDEMYTEALKPMVERYEEFADEVNILTEAFEIEVVSCDDVGGTIDLLATTEDTVYIIDWKYGHNLVDPEENGQGLFYAMCALEDPKTAHIFEGKERIVIGIGQPAATLQGEEILRLWETDKSRIQQYYNDHMDAIDLSDQLIACKTVDEAIAMKPPVAGSHCSYCPAAPICPAKTGLARKAKTLDPLSKEAAVLGEALGMVNELEAWCKQVKITAHEHAELGLKIEGFKLVAKRATRQWTDKDLVLNMVRKARMLKLEEATDSKLKSVAQLEKVCKQKGIDFKKYSAYSESVSSGTSLVKSSDKRPEVPAINALADALAQLEN